MYVYKLADYNVFLVFSMTRLGTEPRSPRPLVNTLTILPMGERETGMEKESEKVKKTKEFTRILRNILRLLEIFIFFQNKLILTIQRDDENEIDLEF